MKLPYRRFESGREERWRMVYGTNSYRAAFIKLVGGSGVRIFPRVVYVSAQGNVPACEILYILRLALSSPDHSLFSILRFLLSSHTIFTFFFKSTPFDSIRDSFQFLNFFFVEKVRPNVATTEKETKNKFSSAYQWFPVNYP